MNRRRKAASPSIPTMVKDCRLFQEAHDVAHDPGLAGHNFWLTCNGHGSGFWDGDWPARLTEASEQFGEFDLYVGDDGLIYN